MIIKFENGYFIESSQTSYDVKFDTGKIKKIKDKNNNVVKEKQIIKRISSSSTLEGAINSLADIKIKRIDKLKVSAILSEIQKIKKELCDVLKAYKIEFKIINNEE